MSFQYQAGPRSSYRLISCRENVTVLLNGGGSLITGVDDDSGAVRSTISTVALASASVRALSTDMGGSCSRGLPGMGHAWSSDPNSAKFGWSVRRSVPGTRAGEAAMWRSRQARSEGQPRKRHLGLRLLFIVVVVLLGLYVLPSPWAFHMGGKFSPVGEWAGYGPVTASNGGRYLLYTELRGGVVNNHSKPGCGLLTGCDTLAGTAQLCTQGGQ